jgi:alpha,alpha-trehalase
VRHAIDHRHAFTQHFDTDSLDASCLLLPLVRFRLRGDERVVNTVNAIAGELTVDGLVLRYRTAETDDGLVGEKGAFAIGTFWLSPLHLYAEEIAPRSGRHWGNFPQAFAHLALINAVAHVICADDAPARMELPVATPVAAAVTEEAR